MTIASASRTAAERIAVAVALLAGACTPMAEPPPQDAPLVIEFVWASAGTQTTPLEDSGRHVPAEVVIRWAAREYTTADIQAIADRQCFTFDRVARPEADPSGTGDRRAQRFECVAPAKR
jgi:hypothetical protein